MEEVTSDSFLTVEIKGYNDMIDGKNFFNQAVKNGLLTYENIKKIAIGQGDDYTNGCLLDYKYLSKQQAHDVAQKVVQQINFIANLDRAGQMAMYFIIEEAKGTVRVL